MTAPERRPRIPYLDPALTCPPGWLTDRSGAPLDQFFGWGVDGYDNLVTLRTRLSREEFDDKADNPFFDPSWICPLKPVQHPGGYYEPPREHLPVRAQRAMARSEARRDKVIGLIANGATIKDACAGVGVTEGAYRQWCKRFPDFKLRVERIRQGLPDSTAVDNTFISRRRYYFGYETYRHQQLIIDAIEDTPDGGITIILVPPEAGKTTLLEDWCSDQLAQDPNTRILYCSETADGHARKVLGTIKDRMTDPERADTEAQYETHLPEWIVRYGPFRDDSLDKDKPWNQDYVKVHKASGRRDYSFQCVGWRSRIYGARCDWLIFDDLQSSESLAQTPQILQNLRRTFFSRPGRKGKTVFIGTRVGVGDAYERLIETLPADIVRVVMIPAIDEHGNSYCPEMWPPEALAVKRAVVGEDGWTTAYMMAPQEAEAVTFSEDLLDLARDRDRTYGLKSANQLSLTLASIDPALGGGNAVIVAETTRTAFSIVAAQVDYNLARNEDIFAILRGMCRYHYSELVVERNSQQRGLARDDRLKEMAKTFGFKITEHETGGNKWDFAFGVGAMASSFIKGEIRFPDSDNKSRKLMEPLRAELLAWRPNVPPRLLRQDLVMALWFGWLIWMKRRKRTGEPTGWRTGGTPWSPGDMSGKWSTPIYAQSDR